MSLIVTEKTFTLRKGATVLASMTYVLDAKQAPWSIDLKCKDGVLLGICLKRGNNLLVSLDDQAKGRPRNSTSKSTAWCWSCGGSPPHRWW